MTKDPPGGIRALIANLGWRGWRRVFLVFLILIVMIISLGSSTNLSREEGSKIREEVEKRISERANPQGIFTNNFAIAMLLFTPGIGPVIGLLVLHNTGVAIAATAVSENIPGLLIVMGLMLLPFTWLEFMAYSTAMTQSVFLTLGLLRRSLRRELVRTGILILIVFATLSLAALIEVLFINPPESLFTIYRSSLVDVGRLDRQPDQDGGQAKEARP